MAKANKKRKVPKGHSLISQPNKPSKVSKKQTTKQRQLTPATPASDVSRNLPFDPTSRVLLVGEGDFSYARSIVSDHSCCDVTATCLDSQSELFSKYTPQGEQNATYLLDEGQVVLYGVDATKLDTDKQLKRQVSSSALFDVIVFNFPHVGGKSKDVNRQVRFNQELLVSFFASCSKLLAPQGSGSGGGQIIVTLFEGEPYTLWNVRDLARHAGLEVMRSFRFVSGLYPSYKHARTLGNLDGGGGWKGEDRLARSYMFRRKSGIPVDNPADQSSSVHRKRARAEVDSSDDDVK